LIGPWTHIPRRPVRSNDGIAEVQAAIEYEYEYRFAEYEYEQEQEQEQEYDASLATDILARWA